MPHVCQYTLTLFVFLAECLYFVVLYFFVEMFGIHGYFPPTRSVPVDCLL